MHASRIADLGATVKGLGNAESLDVANDGASIDEVEADGRVRKFLALFHVDDIGSGRKEAAGLALERQVLGVELPGGEHGDREEAANSKSVDGGRVHFI